MTGEVACELRGVAFTYPGAAQAALVDISFDVRGGAWLALLGSNGSGKSTLARILNALLIPTQGRSLVYGADTSIPEERERVRRQVAMVFQNPENQIVAATVEEDTAFGPENLGLPSEEIRRRVEWALGVVGLLEMRKTPVYALSGGQKQRLAVAGAMALMPRCLVLDEATSMLDPQGRAELLAVLRRLHHEGMTLVSITHRLEEILPCTEVRVLDAGRLVWYGTPFAFLEQRRDEWAAEDTPMLSFWREARGAGFLPPHIAPEPGEVADSLWASLSTI